MQRKSVLPVGVQHFPGHLKPGEQKKLLAEIRNAISIAPLFTPTMPRTGKPLSVRMSNCGELGWVCDKQGGYRYQKHHPDTGKPWPPMPQMLLDIWQEISNFPHPPQACLINFYNQAAKMGLHQDKDEQNFDAPVLSISLGDSCLFRVGATTRGGRTMSFKLHSGDVVILGGESRLAFHGVDRIYPGTSMLLKNGGRLNLTMRRVG
ncbi:MAG: alpha-ketoglutarate-dependent dioxygenase AlkB [Rhizobiaceae bacterium]|nr:alpha-ketoglutarate-dependent dioxygenase AlkB [Rhizobiaceae bacterium]